MNNLVSLILALTCGMCGLPILNNHSDTSCGQTATLSDFSIPAIVCEKPASTQIDAANNSLGQNNANDSGNSSFDLSSILNSLGQNNANDNGNSSFDLNSILNSLG
ncbi:MAG: hypothetical protein LBL93_00060, partial [Ruminococcus sp.]|nr:hypothetical protein [Ruminococcus sp.]